MSTLAAGYYPERALRLGLSGTPAILSGEPWALLEGSRINNYISLQQPNPELLKTTNSRYAEALKSITPFIMQGAVQQFPEVSTITHEWFSRANEQHVNGMVEGRLFPAYLKAGRIYDIQIEAVARSEVVSSMLNRATVNHWEARRSDAEDRSAYLVVSAMLHAGRQLGQVACLTVLYVNRMNRTGLTPHYLGTPYKINDLLAQSGLWQSRATRRYIDAWGVANAVVQSVRRGHTDRNKGLIHI